MLLGPPGVGKTNLGAAIGISAIHNGYTVAYRSVFDLAEEFAEAYALGSRKELVLQFIKPNLLIIDEFGMRKLPPNAAEDLLEIFHRRYNNGSTVIATNKPIEDWGRFSITKSIRATLNPPVRLASFRGNFRFCSSHLFSLIQLQRLMLNVVWLKGKNVNYTNLTE